MDILAHGLWSNAAARAINKSQKIKSRLKPLKPWHAIFWGIFPDMASFGVMTFWAILNLITGGIDISDFHKPQDTTAIVTLTSLLYNITHSIFIFLIIFGFLILIRKIRKKEQKIPWEICAWILHILVDIPTHSYQFYPTPFFWPISSWKFDGLSWGTPWFMIANYSAIIIVYILIKLIRPAKSN